MYGCWVAPHRKDQDQERSQRAEICSTVEDAHNYFRGGCFICICNMHKQGYCEGKITAS